MHKHYFLVGTFLGLLSLSACPADKSAESAPAAQSDEAKKTYQDGVLAKALGVEHEDLSLSDEQRLEIKKFAQQKAKQLNEDPKELEAKLLKAHEATQKLFQAKNKDDVKKLLFEMNKEKFEQRKRLNEAKGTLKGIYTMLIAYYAETDVFQADLDFGLGKGHKKGPKFEDEHFVYTVKVSKSGFSATAKSKPDLGLGEMTIAFENGSPTNGRIQVVKAAKTR